MIVHASESTPDRPVTAPWYCGCGEVNMYDLAICRTCRTLRDTNGAPDIDPGWAPSGGEA